MTETRSAINLTWDAGLLTFPDGTTAEISLDEILSRISLRAAVARAIDASEFIAGEPEDETFGEYTVSQAAFDNLRAAYGAGA